jgi:predicted PurR-regulated permease PerM
MQTKIIERYFFFGLLFLTLLFTFLIFRPFWIVLVLGLSFAIVLYPLHKIFLKWRMSEGVAAFLAVIIFTIILCGPILGVGVLIFNQSKDLNQFVVSEGGAMPFMEKVDTAVNTILPAGIHFDMQEKTSEFVSYLSRNTANIFSSTVSAFFSFILMLLIIFYALKDGMRWRDTLVLLSPLSDKDDEKIIARLERSINGIITGNLFICLLQGLLVGLGFWIFGVPNGALWGVVAAVASLLPTFGTSLVTVPGILYLLATGNTTPAIGLIIWSALAVGMVDNFLSPILVGRKTDIPPLLILFSVLGGISLLGPVGILMGPLTMSLLYTLISIYRHEFKQTSIL